VTSEGSGFGLVGFLEFVVSDTRGQETRGQGDGMEEQAITAGFPWTHEENSTILVFELRRISSRGGARHWPLTLGWVVRDRSQSLVYITERDGANLQNSGVSKHD